VGDDGDAGVRDDRDPPGLDPLPDRSVADAVAVRLRDAIHTGDYPPGARLVERALARQLAVSHIPIREALTRLEEEGLIVRQPRRGARVAELSPTALDEISSLRSVLEGFVAKRVQERLTPAAENELRVLVAQMVAAADRGDVTVLLALDRRFHERLWQLADHAILLEVVAQLRGRIARFLGEATRLLEPDGLRAHAESHRALVDALASGDPRAAQRAMRRHIEIAARRIARSEGLDAEGAA
jgi:DNA-binding GntR family transcriptional regulator